MGNSLGGLESILVATLLALESWSLIHLFIISLHSLVLLAHRFQWIILNADTTYIAE